MPLILFFPVGREDGNETEFVAHFKKNIYIYFLDQPEVLENFYKTKVIQFLFSIPFYILKVANRLFSFVVCLFS